MHIFFGSLPDGSIKFEDTSSVLFFLYQTHQEFQLEDNPTETLLFPRDELLFFKLVLRQIESDVERFHANLLDTWIKVCRRRIFKSSETDDLISQLADEVEKRLKINNLTDRVLVSRRIIEEFDLNVELRTVLLNASYVVASPNLDWFEHAILQTLIEIEAPNIDFRFDNHQENRFYAWRMCNPRLRRRYKRCVAGDILLSYLGLAVNMKDIIRLRLVMDNPPRGLGDAAFATLHRLSRVEDVSAFQVASSFVRRESLQGSIGTHSSLHPLKAWSVGLTDLVSCMVRCQDALSGTLGDTLLTIGSADARMSVDEAGSSVIACLKQIGRIFSKPSSRKFHCSFDSENTCHSMQVTPDDVSPALKRLCDRTIRLIAAQSTVHLCHETPNRPLGAGGSMYGRAALKLARLLLVTEADLVATEHVDMTVENTSVTSGVLTSHVATAQNQPSVATPPRLSSPTVNCTPTTDGRGSRLLPMFASPLLSNLPLSPYVGDNGLLAVEEEQSVAQLEEFDDPIKLPTCPVFSRYQSNLDWASEQYTPPCRGDRRKSSSVISSDTIDCHSMPAWITCSGGSLEKDMDAAVVSKGTTRGTQSGSSLPSTPTKRLAKTEEGQGKKVGHRHSFPTRNKNSMKTVEGVSVKAGKCGQMKRSKAKSGRAAVQHKQLPNRRTLTEFFLK